MILAIIATTGFSQDEYYEEILGPNSGFAQFFGLSIVNDGSDFFIASNGSIHCYSLVDEIWSEYQTIVSPEPSTSFGYKVQLDNNKLYISAPLEGDGKIYSYQQIDGNWTEIEEITPEELSIQKIHGPFFFHGNYLLIYNEQSEDDIDSFHEVILFELVEDDWIEQTRFGSASVGFGVRFMMNDQRIYISDTRHGLDRNRYGAVLCYQYETNVWQETQLISDLAPKSRTML